MHAPRCPNGNLGVPGSGQKHSLVALVLPLAWYVGTRVHPGTCSLEEVTRAIEAGRKPCAQEDGYPSPATRPGLGRRTEALWAMDLKSRWKPRPHLRAGNIKQGLRGSLCDLAAHVTDLPTPSFILSQEFYAEVFNSTKGECETLIQKELFQPGCFWFPIIGLTIKEIGLNNKGNLPVYKTEKSRGIGSR